MRQVKEATELELQSILQYIFWNGYEKNRLYLNQGDGSFAEGVDIGSEVDSTTAVEFALIDDDSHLDLVVGNDGEVNRIYINDGLGNLGQIEVAIPINVSIDSSITSGNTIAAELLAQIQQVLNDALLTAAKILPEPFIDFRDLQPTALAYRHAARMIYKVTGGRVQIRIQCLRHPGLRLQVRTPNRRAVHRIMHPRFIPLLAQHVMLNRIERQLLAINRHLYALPRSDDIARPDGLHRIAPNHMINRQRVISIGIGGKLLILAERVHVQICKALNIGRQLGTIICVLLKPAIIKAV